jgi:hypothetical protein
MFTISTVFIKGQIPGTTIGQLVTRYKRELEEQSVSSVSVNADTIYFANDAFKIVLARYSNKFSGFSKGQIRIEDTGTEYIVYLEANLARLLVSAGTGAGIVVLLALFTVGFNLLLLIMGLIVFGVLILVGYIQAKIFFPVYFNSLRNNIESELQQPGGEKAA